MRWLVLFLTLAAPAAAQSTEAALARVADALDREFRVSFAASAVRHCNLRDPVWAGRVIMRARETAGAAYQRELDRLPEGERSGFERDAFIMQAQYRSRLNTLMARPSQDAVTCLDLRRETRGLAYLDGIAAGRH